MLYLDSKNELSGFLSTYSKQILGLKIIPESHKKSKVTIRITLLKLLFKISLSRGLKLKLN
jgi:hypothetical protein